MQTRPVHVVVLDVQMPQLGGLQAVKLMREILKDPPPAILLSDRLSNNLLREALAVDIFSVIPKPVELNRLLIEFNEFKARLENQRTDLMFLSRKEP